MIRCPRCQHENPSGAAFCDQCGARLEAACPSCGEPNRAGAKFCRKCGQALAQRVGTNQASPSKFDSPEAYTPRHLAEKILTSKAAREGERKQVTVLFADLKGSMELLADRDPEEARQLLDPVIERMVEAVHHYEGTVNQVMGDGIMAIFGAPIGHEDHAVRACYAAVRMQRRVSLYADELQRGGGTPVQIRVGLNSGEVVVGAISSDLRMDYTAVGQTTHLAARMEQMAKPGSTLVTEGTLKLAEGYVQAKRLGTVPVKGLENPTPVYELTGIVPARSRFQASVARGLTRFVGRESELQQLAHALERAAAGHGQAVAVVGEAGVGKSRLVWEFARSHRTHGWLVLESGSVSYDKATPYLPVIGLLKTYCRIQERDDPRAIRERVAGKLLMLDRALEPFLAPVLALLDVPVEDGAWTALDPPQRQQRTLDAIKGLLLRESQVQPLLLLFEDLHWIDAETQALLDSLIESLPAARLLLLVNYRPEYRHTWSGKSYYHQLRVDPLPPESANELLKALVGEDRTLDPLKRVLIAQTEGNPFFLEESVRTLVETQVLAGERGAYRMTKAPETWQIPATAQAILAARIDRLTPEDKRLLQSASVIGKDVPFSLLQAIAELPEDELRGGLARLRTAEFLYETRLFPDHQYTFKHALTHEVAFASLLGERRRALHARIVEAIERLYADHLTEYVNLLGHHAFRGEVWDKAVRYLRQAATRAAARSAHHEASDSLERALAALHHLSRTPDRLREAIDLHLAARNSLWPLTNHQKILEHLKAAEALAESLDDQRRLGQVASFMTQHYRVIGEPERAIASAERALVIARALDDRGLEIGTNFRLGLAYLNVGDHRRASDVLARNVAALEGTRLQERAGQPGLPSVLSRAWLALSLAELGEFGKGLAHGLEAVRIAEEADHPYSIVSAYVGLGGVQLARGDLDDALATLARGLAVCRRYDIPVQFRLIASELGFAYALVGRTADAIPLLEQAANEEGGLAMMAGRSLLIIRLAEAYLLAGRAGEAATLASRALDLARKRKERGYEAWGLRLAAATAASGLRLETALRSYEAAMELAAELGMRPLHAIAGLESGILFQRLGTKDRARVEISAAAELFEDMQMRRWLERARAALAEIE